MNNRLKILILIRPFWKTYPKHKQKFDMIRAIEEFAEVKYWYEDGNIIDILNNLNFKPDFIFHYDIAWRYKLAPRITGLDKVNIPKGCFIIDLHYNPSRRDVLKHSEQSRVEYIRKNRIDLVFAPTKHPFYQTYPEFTKIHRWLPWSINPKIIKDWKLKKDIKYLLMGQVHISKSDTPLKRNPEKGTYGFRESVLEKMSKVNGFLFHPHPGHQVANSDNALIDIRYAKELNRSNIFFTCGGRQKVAVLKFFEAPGCRTLLLAEPNKDITDLGFIDGVNFVACTKGDILEKALYYDNNVEERERITENGYAFIHRYHTNDVRARQFIDYVSGFLKSGLA